MLRISRFTVEDLCEGCVTDARRPRFAFALESDRAGACLARAVLRVGDWALETAQQVGLRYDGPALSPFTRHEARLEVWDEAGETDSASLSFETGRMGQDWQGAWISDAGYHFTEKGVSPVPMVFRRDFKMKKPLRRARVYATAMGIYDLYLNGTRVWARYFAPGFTSYPHSLMYQSCDVTELLGGENRLEAVVAGGWAVGSFVFTRRNRLAHDRQALLLELRLEYGDGSVEVLGTDERWQVTEDGPCRMADLYDGETYDATVELDRAVWRQAAREKLRLNPRLRADYGAPVLAHEVFAPKAVRAVGAALVYDFGQNLAGVVRMDLRGRAGQKITVRHAEILNRDGSLNTVFLRSAKATATYICRDGAQTWSPRFTYMGFRYVSVEGIAREDLTLEVLALYSDVGECGSFSCSDARLNQLQSNIRWGAKSNLVDIPTDCPQRDERMGWTGDIAVFAPTACFNFDMSRFLRKWLRDLRDEQFPGGGIPNTVPRQGYGFPTTMPDMAVDWWDDACALVPWAEYEARGDLELLRLSYPSIQRYVKACLFWAGLGSVGKRRYIWDTPGIFHFGDWVAPDVPKMSQWQGRAKWTATASLFNMCTHAAKIAHLLGEEEDARHYEALGAKVADAYCALLTDGQGKLREEFQTAYVLPLYLGMFPDRETALRAAENLARLVERGNWCIGTGFPGTPYILFALADNGQAEAAYRMLLNERCPSWLYEVRVGATTIWERWDGLDEDGQCPIGDDGTGGMISYNHYASGAVGAFLYRRVAGLEPLEAGWRRFRARPLPGGGLTHARASVRSPYGEAAVSWEIAQGVFTLTVRVPVSCTCLAELPDGHQETLGSGLHTLRTEHILFKEEQYGE